MLSSPRESTKFLYRHAKKFSRRQEVGRFLRRLPHESKVVEPIISGSEHNFTGTQRHKIPPSAQWGATSLIPPERGGGRSRSQAVVAHGEVKGVEGDGVLLWM